MSPQPSLPIRYSFGTKTFSSWVTEFSIPFRPMNAFRCRTVTPSLSYGRMNALMPVFGVRAITTTTSATAPLVAHSFVPLST